MENSHNALTPPTTTESGDFQRPLGPLPGPSRRGGGWAGEQEGFSTGESQARNAASFHDIKYTSAALHGTQKTGIRERNKFKKMQ